MYLTITKLCGRIPSARQALRMTQGQIAKNHLSRFLLDFLIHPARTMIVNALAMYTYRSDTGDPCVNQIDANASHAQINAMTNALGNDTNRTYPNLFTPAS